MCVRLCTTRGLILCADLASSCRPRLSQLAHPEVSVKKTSVKKTKAKKAATPPSRKSAPKTKSVKKPVQKSSGRSAATASKGKTAQAGAPGPEKVRQVEPRAKLTLPTKSAVTSPSEAKTQQPSTTKVSPVTKQNPTASRASARVDLPPDTGYSVVVDGHFKGHHAAEVTALADAKALKARFPFLRIEIFDAAKKTRSSVG